MKERKNRQVWSVVAVTLAVAVTAALTPPAAAAELDALKQTQSAFASIARQAVPAVVFIRVEKEVVMGGQTPYGYNDPSELFGEEFMRRFFGYPGRRQPERRYRQQGQGSGFLISKDGYILTNSHVVGDADEIVVQLHDGREFEAERVGADARSEVAVIKIEGDDFPFLAMGDSDALDIGNWVVAVGNPFGLAETVTAGIVSAKGRSNIGIADYENFIQTDAAINPGNSGGPLLNIDGEVVGINTAIYSRSGGYMGIGFAIPINMALSIKDQLMDTGRVVRGYLGVYIQPLTPSLAESFGLDTTQGILISDVTEGSAAEDAGLEQGDVILKLDGQAVESVGSFRNAVANHPPGSRIELTVQRDGRTRTVEAVTGTLPGEESLAGGGGGLPEDLGLTVQELTDELSARMGYEGESGVLVTAVDMGSAAWDAGIRRGNLIVSVNRQPVSSVREFRRAVAQADRDKAVLMRIRDEQASRYVTLRLD